MESWSGVWQFPETASHWQRFPVPPSTSEAFPEVSADLCQVTSSSADIFFAPCFPGPPLPWVSSHLSESPFVSFSFFQPCPWAWTSSNWALFCCIFLMWSFPQRDCHITQVSLNVQQWQANPAWISYITGSPLSSRRHPQLSRGLSPGVCCPFPKLKSVYMSKL